jgi:hypothetical protein
MNHKFQVATTALLLSVLFLAQGCEGIDSEGKIIFTNTEGQRVDKPGGNRVEDPEVRRSREQREKKRAEEREREENARWEATRAVSSGVRNDNAVRTFSYVGQTEFGNGIDRSELTLD